MTLPSPVKVSPLIKFFRYTLLLAGIMYGATRKKALQLKEAGKKEERDRLKAERDAQIAEEKRAASDRDIAQIVAIFSDEPKFKVEEQSYENSDQEGGIICKLDEVEDRSAGTLKPTDEADSSATEQCNMPPKVKDSRDHSALEEATLDRDFVQNDDDFNVKSEEKGEYFVETFENGFPYAASEDKEYDFMSKAVNE